MKILLIISIMIFSVSVSAQRKFKVKKPKLGKILNKEVEEPSEDEVSVPSDEMLQSEYTICTLQDIYRDDDAIYLKSNDALLNGKIVDTAYGMDVEYKNGLMNGVCINYRKTYWTTSSGEVDVLVKSQSYFVDGLAQGESTQKENDRLMHKENYLDGKLHGTQTYYYASSIMTEPWYIENYKNGMKHGEFIEWNCDCNICYNDYEPRACEIRFILKKENYFDDVLHGTQEYYSEHTGLLIGQAEFTNGTGQIIRYHDNGVKYSEENYTRGEMDGAWREWDEEGKLVREWNFVNGIEHGYQREYWGDFMHSDENYVNGLEEGLHRQWEELEDGSYHLTHECNWVSGEYHGTCREWSDGILISEENYVHGIEDGVHKSWDYDGKIVSERVFENGEEISSKYWDEDGNLEEE